MFATAFVLLLVGAASLPPLGGLVQISARSPNAVMQGHPCPVGYHCERILEMGCVRRGAVVPVLRPRLPGRCTRYRFTIAFQAAYNGSHVWIDQRLMRCPIRAIDKRTYEVHSKCEVDNNGGGEAKVATVSTTLMIVNHKTNWRYPVFILLGVDVHGRLLIAKVTPPGCPAKVCR